MKLALHTWTLDTTKLADVVRIVKETGWDAIELRRLDFVRAAEAGGKPEEVIDLVKKSGLPVACVGVEAGWMWADGAERARLLSVFAEQCARAATLGARLVMSPVDVKRGDLARAAASVREVGDIAATHRVRVAIEYNSQAEHINCLAVLREILAKAAQPACGLLLDTYHIQRSGDGLRPFEDVAPEEIAYVQFSDVPATGLEPGKALNRLIPGRGVVPFREFFQLVRRKGYDGYASFEGPNPATWARPPADVAREALAATRALL